MNSSPGTAYPEHTQNTEKTMKQYTLTNEQARNFLLLKHGLLGEHIFEGKQGVCDYIRQAGCIQYDPIDICGKNAELVLQSRIVDFRKEMLNELLYTDRKLVDYFDKNMAIFLTEDWKYFSRTREVYRTHGRNREKIDAAADKIMQIIREKGCACSRDIDMNETVDWPWGPTSLSRAALETLYFRGDLIVHHKKGTQKYYALAEDYIDQAILNTENPNQTQEDFLKWHALRRIGSVGLLPNKASAAWLGIGDMKNNMRNKVFSSLLAEGRIIECSVEGIADKLYCRTEDEAILKRVSRESNYQKRLEFIAPLDNLVWDRRLIGAIFGFEYKWEIYTPLEQRKYGYYVLPVLYGNRFVGRIELVAEKKAGQLNFRNFWQEENATLDADWEEKLQARLEQFAAFNHCDRVVNSNLLS